MTQGLLTLNLYLIERAVLDLLRLIISAPSLLQNHKKET